MYFLASRNAVKASRDRAYMRQSKCQTPFFPKTCLISIYQSNSQHCLPTLTSTTPMYFENRLIKTAQLLYLDCLIYSLSPRFELQLEILFDLSHPSSPTDTCEHSCVKQRDKHTSDQHASTGVSLLQFYWQKCFLVF